MRACGCVNACLLENSAYSRVAGECKKATTGFIPANERQEGATYNHVNAQGQTSMLVWSRRTYAYHTIEDYKQRWPDHHLIIPKVRDPNDLSHLPLPELKTTQ